MPPTTAPTPVPRTGTTEPIAAPTSAPSCLKTLPAPRAADLNPLGMVAGRGGVIVAVRGGVIVARVLTAGCLTRPKHFSGRMTADLSVLSKV